MGMSSTLIRITAKELNAYLEDSSLLEKRIYQDEEDAKSIDLDKNWDGILFLLTGGGIASGLEHDLARIIFSGNLIDEEQDLGYGPAHYLTATEIQDYYTKLSAFGIDELKNNFDPIKMDELDVYPSGIWQRENEEARGYLLEAFEELKAFYAKAVEAKQAVISFIC